MKTVFLILSILSILSFEAKSEQVRLIWDRSPDTNVIGFNIYFGTGMQLTNVLTVGNVTNATVTNLTVGQTYSFLATAFNAYGAESDPSNRVSATIPARPPPPGKFIILRSTDMVEWKEFFRLQYVP